MKNKKLFEVLVQIKRKSLFRVLLLFIFSFSTVLGQDLPEGFLPIFNGMDLQGWHPSLTTHHGTSGNFKAENKNIILRQNPYGQGGLLLTDDHFKDFEFYMEFKGHPGTNGGLLLRSSESGSAYQLELAGDGERGTGAFFGEMLRVSNSVPAPDLSGIWKKGDWNSIRIKMMGEAPFVQLWINGENIWETKMERNDLIADKTEGSLALQLHWSATLQPIPGGSCCGYSWKPEAEHRFRNLGIKIIE